MGLTVSDAKTLVTVGFPVFVVLCLFVCVFTGLDGDDDATTFYTANQTLRPWQNGLAITGDYLSAATVLGTTGLIAVSGFDGILLAASTVAGLAVLTLLIAEPLRRAGRYTAADALARRCPGPSLRVAMSAVTLAVCLPYLVLQLSGVATMVTLMLGLDGSTARAWSIAVIGTLMVTFSATGGMRGTGWIQIVKTVILFVINAVLAGWVLGRFGWDPGRLLSTAATGSGAGGDYLLPGLQYGRSLRGGLDLFGLQATGILAVASLPHLTMRVFAAPHRQALRTSLRWAIGLTAAYCVLLVVIGLGVPALVGGRSLRAADPGGSTGLLFLARALNPSGLLLGAVACAVFVTALAAVAGITLAAAASLAHDLHAHALRRGRLVNGQEIRSARLATAALGVVTVLLAMAAGGWNLQGLSVLALTLAASALTPTLLLGLWWKRFTTTGALAVLYGSTALVLLLAFFSPLVSGSPASLLPDRDFAWFPLPVPGIVTVPAGFLLGWLGSRLGPRRPDPAPDQQPAASRAVAR